MKRLFLLFGAMVSLGIITQGQTWMQDFNKKKTGDFREAITTFNKYCDMHPGQKIQGEKQFKRMEWFMQRRMDSSGSFPARIYHDEANRVIQARNGRTPGSGAWTSLGPFLTPMSQQTGEKGGSGRIDCIGFHPTDPAILYVGTPTGGLWRTTDSGQTWASLTDNLPTLGISAIVVHPQHPDTIFIATGTRDVWWETYSVGVMKSTDGGLNWEETGLNYTITEQTSTTGLIMDPANPEIMLASTSGGIYRTVDGGDHWNLACPGNFKDIKSKPGDFSVIYAASFSFSGTGPCHLFKSTDSGLTFSQVNTIGVSASLIGRMLIGVTPANPGIVYLLCSNTTDYGFQGVYRSDDSGSTWVNTSASCNLNLLGWSANGLDQGGQGWYDLSLSVSPVNPDEIHVGGVNIWKSLDGGVTWQLNAQWQGFGGVDYVHADIHELKYNPLDSILYASCDGGIYQLQQGGSDWLDLSDGLTIYQAYRLGLYQSQDDLAIVSPQDNGTTLFDDQTCKEIVLAEACDNFFDFTNPNTLYYGGYGTGLSRSYNSGLTRASIHPPGETKSVFLPPFLMHPSDPNILYSAFHEAYKSVNKGTNWTKITNGLSGNTYFQVMKVAAANPDYILLSTISNIWITKNGGGTWTNILNGLPGGISITDIGISDADPDQIWVTFGQFYEGEKVYHSHDGGSTWTNISSNLPNMAVNCIIPVANSNSAIYVGTDIGVYYMDDGTGGWIDYSEGLPNVIVLEMEINPSNHKIKAATYGRGLWEADLYNSPTSVPDRETSVDPHLYPNPVSDYLNISFSAPRTQEYTLQICSVTGQPVFQKKLQVLQGSYNERFRLDFLQQGVYLLRLRDATGISCHKKIVKL
jgi:photosystem II stability/assembly factor-like uncharacterized protein